MHKLKYAHTIFFKEMTFRCSHGIKAKKLIEVMKKNRNFRGNLLPATLLFVSPAC